MIYEVRSSMFDRVERCDNNEMIVHFKNGSQYRYYDIKDDLFDSFIASDSVGKFYNANIKGMKKGKLEKDAFKNRGGWRNFFGFYD